VLAAARALFAERGDEVQMPEVAQAAGVGVGTVYRHFPTRQALVEAAAERRFAEIAEFARAECQDQVEPGQGVARYLRHVGEVLAADRGLSVAVQAVRGAAESEPRGPARRELETVVAQLIQQDQAAGTLRQDVTTEDVYLLVGALSATIRTSSGDWRRLVDLALNGLRTR
jgi:AcrR family transcriptional regulator